MSTKILHIGPTFAPPMLDMISQIREHTDFSNVIISNNSEKFIMPDGFFSDDMPIYVYPYDKDNIETPQMKSFVDNVLNVEKPDIIIGHLLGETSIILNYALTVSNVPGISWPGGLSDVTKFLDRSLTKLIFFNNLTVLKKLNYLLEVSSHLIDMMVSAYGIKQSDFAFSGPPVNLSQYTDHIPNTDRPVLLLAKPRGDKYIIPTLPEMFRRFPNMKVHAFYVEPGVTIAKKFGVYKKITWHNNLSQENFSKLIKSCNIVFTLTGDTGTGNTALQASYSGCVNIMKRCTTSFGMIEDNKNAVMCTVKRADVTNKLAYSIENLSVLCKRFKENNKHLLQYDREKTWDGLYQAILDCLEGRKSKIVPICVEAV